MQPALISNKLLDQLVIVDVQERLCGAMPQDELQEVIRNCGILLQAAKLLAIPVICTEQVPSKLGPTLPQLAQWLPAGNVLEKVSFSCCGEIDFLARIDTSRPQIVLAGMEVHVCVLQTALQFLENGHQRVFVAEDAVISRNPAHKANALARLRQAGAVVTNTESVVFEWLRVAEGDAFRQIARLVR